MKVLNKNLTLLTILKTPNRVRWFLDKLIDPAITSWHNVSQFQELLEFKKVSNYNDICKLADKLDDKKIISEKVKIKT